EWDRSLEHATLALARYRGAKHPEGEAHALIRLAAAHRLRGAPADAVADARQAVAMAHQLQSAPRGADAWTELALAQRDTGEIAAALESARDAIRLTETVRRNISGDNLRTSYFATAAGRYDLCIDLLMRADRVREALEMSERARARSL